MSGPPVGRAACEQVVVAVAEQFGLSTDPARTVVRVKTTPTHHIDIVPMTYNWRLITTPVDQPNVYDRGWCYTGQGNMLRALAEAMAWPDDDGIEHVPYGWYKTAYAGVDIRQEEFLFR